MDFTQKPLSGFTTERYGYLNGKKVLIHRMTVNFETKPYTATFNDGKEISQLTFITVEGKNYWMDSGNELLRPEGDLDNPITWEQADLEILDVDAFIVELNKQLHFAAREA